MTLSSVISEIATGDSLRLSDLARRFRVNPSTVFRWAFRGLSDQQGQKVKLEVVHFGKSWRTSDAALRRFLAALPQSGSTSSTEASPRPPAKRQRDSARAKATLHQKYGI